MKIYLIMHEGKPNWWKLESWVDIEKVGKNGVCVKSVRAFTKKKYAKKWLNDRKWEYLKIVSAVIPSPNLKLENLIRLLTKR